MKAVGVLLLVTWDGVDFSGSAVGAEVYYFRAAGSSLRFVLLE